MEEGVLDSVYICAYLYRNEMSGLEYIKDASFEFGNSFIKYGNKDDKVAGS